MTEKEKLVARLNELGTQLNREVSIQIPRCCTSNSTQASLTALSRKYPANREGV